MNKKTFDMIMEYSKKVNELYFELEKMHDSNVAEKLIEDLDKLEYKFLGFEEGEDLSKYFDEGKETYITEAYENIPRYLKLYMIRECEDDMVLCVSTADSYYLVPKKLLATEEEANS